MKVVEIIKEKLSGFFGKKAKETKESQKAKKNEKVIKCDYCGEPIKVGDKVVHKGGKVFHKHCWRKVKNQAKRAIKGGSLGF